MVAGLARMGVLVALACGLIWGSGAAAFAKGPDQAVVSGPGLDQPILVRTPGAPTIGPDLASLIESSGIFDQLWCRTCDDPSAKPPTANLGPVYLVRYRLPAVIGRRPGWVEQRVYPFAGPQPVTFVAQGQPFWGRRTVGGWFRAGPRLTRLLVGIGVPRTSTRIDAPIDTVTGPMPSWFAPRLAAGGVAILAAIIVGLIVLGRVRTRSAPRTPSA